MWGFTITRNIREAENLRFWFHSYRSIFADRHIHSLDDSRKEKRNNRGMVWKCPKCPLRGDFGTWFNLWKRYEARITFLRGTQSDKEKGESFMILVYKDEVLFSSIWDRSWHNDSNGLRRKIYWWFISFLVYSASERSPDFWLMMMEKTRIFGIEFDNEDKTTLYVNEICFFNFLDGRSDLVFCKGYQEDKGRIMPRIRVSSNCHEKRN